MKNLGYISLLLWGLLSSTQISAQYRYSVQVRDSLTDRTIEDVLILDTKGRYLAETNAYGKAWVESDESSLRAVFMLLGYQKKLYYLSAEGEQMSTVYLSPDTIESEEAIVHASKIVQNLSQSQLRQESLRRASEVESLLPAANTVQDVVSNLASTQATEDPLTGSSVGINGLGGENVKLLIDGQPVTGRSAGNIDLSQFSLSDIQEVQVYFGPQSIIYGSDASGGLINLVSFEHSDHKVSAFAQTQIESIGKINLDGHLDFSLGENRLGLKLGRYYFDGASLYDSLLRKKTWLPKEQYFVGGHWNHRWNLKNGRSFLAQARTDLYREFLYDPGEPKISNSQQTATAIDNTYVTNRNNSSVNFSSWGKNWNHSLQNSYSYYNRNTLTYFRDFVGKTKTETSTSGTSYDVFDLFQSRYIAQRKSDKLGLQLGAQYDRETGSGSKLLSIEKRYEAAVFGIADLRQGNWHLIPGLRWNYYSTAGFQLLPALQITSQLSEKVYFEAGYARTYRVPSLKEQYLYFIDINHNITGNPDLSPESANSFNTGIKIVLDQPSYILTSKISTAYYDSRNKILLTSTIDSAQSYTYNNVANITNSAQILDLTLKPYLENGDLEFRSATNWLYFFEYGDARNKSSYIQNFFVRWTNPRWQTAFTLNSKTNLQQRVFVSDVDEIVARELKNYTMLNLGISRDFFDHALVTELGVRNLLDVRQVEFKDNLGSVGTGGGAHGTSDGSALASPGRSFYLRLGYSLH